MIHIISIAIYINNYKHIYILLYYIYKHIERERERDLNFKATGDASCVSGPTIALEAGHPVVDVDHWVLGRPYL